MIVTEGPFKPDRRRRVGSTHGKKSRAEKVKRAIGDFMAKHAAKVTPPAPEPSPTARVMPKLAHIDTSPPAVNAVTHEARTWITARIAHLKQSKHPTPEKQAHHDWTQRKSHQLPIAQQARFKALHGLRKPSPAGNEHYKALIGIDHPAYRTDFKATYTPPESYHKLAPAPTRQGDARKAYRRDWRGPLRAKGYTWNTTEGAMLVAMLNEAVGGGAWRTTDGKFSSLVTHGGAAWVPHIPKAFRERVAGMGGKVKASGTGGGLALVFEDMAKMETCFRALMNEGIRLSKHDIPGVLFVHALVESLYTPAEKAELHKFLDTAPKNHPVRKLASAMIAGAWKGKRGQVKITFRKRTDESTFFLGKDGQDPMRVASKRHVEVVAAKVANHADAMPYGPKYLEWKQHAIAHGAHYIGVRGFVPGKGATHLVAHIAHEPKADAFAKKAAEFGEVERGSKQGLFGESVTDGVVLVERASPKTVKVSFTTRNPSAALHHVARMAAKHNGKVTGIGYGHHLYQFDNDTEAERFHTALRYTGGHYGIKHGYLKEAIGNDPGPEEFGAGAGPAPDQLPGGKGDGKTDADFDPAEVEMGVKVEMEHTKDPAVAREIAHDHLAEHPHYYTALKAAGLADELKESAAQPDPEDARHIEHALDQYRSKHTRGLGNRVHISHRMKAGETHITVPRSYARNLQKHLADAGFHASRQPVLGDKRRTHLMLLHRYDWEKPSTEAPYKATFMDKVHGTIANVRGAVRKAVKVTATQAREKVKDVSSSVSRLRDHLVARMSEAVDEDVDMVEDFTEVMKDQDAATDRAQDFADDQGVNFAVLACGDGTFLVMSQEDAEERSVECPHYEVVAICVPGDEDDDDELEERHSARSRIQGRLSRAGLSGGQRARNRNARASARARRRRGALYAAKKKARKALHNPDSYK